MELTQEQINELKPVIERYELTLKHGIKIFTDNDVATVKKISAQIGLEIKEAGCMGCDGTVWTTSIFRPIYLIYNKQK